MVASRRGMAYLPMAQRPAKRTGLASVVLPPSDRAGRRAPRLTRIWHYLTAYWQCISWQRGFIKFNVVPPLRRLGALASIDALAPRAPPVATTPNFILPLFFRGQLNRPRTMLVRSITRCTTLPFLVNRTTACY